MNAPDRHSKRRLFEKRWALPDVSSGMEKKMKLAFLYAGQGSQCAGMGKDLYEKYPEFAEVIDRAEAGFDLKQMMFEAPVEELSQTQYTQPALAAFAAGVTAILYQHGIRPDAVAGLSLGEYSALHAADVFDAETLIRLTAFRGKAMQEASGREDLCMCAVIGLSSDVVEEVVGKAAAYGKTLEQKEAEAFGTVEVANYNTKTQTVIAGAQPAVEKAKEMLSEAGARKLRALKVSSAFHTSYMKPVSGRLEEYFKGIDFSQQKCPVIFNTTARPLADGETIQELLKKQVCTSVRMQQTIEYLAEQGVERIIEIGPGKTLSGMVKKTAAGVETMAISDVESLEAVLDKFSQGE